MSSRKENPKGLLYDFVETGRVNLPMDEKALWFLIGCRETECSMLGLNFVSLTSMING